LDSKSIEKDAVNSELCAKKQATHKAKTWSYQKQHMIAPPF